MVREGRIQFDYSVNNEHIFDKPTEVLQEIFVDLPNRRDIMSLVFRIKG